MSETQELAVITPKDLQHLNELEVEIAGYKEQYKDLQITDENDKEGYELVRKAIGVLRPKRTGLEAERKSVVKPYNDVVYMINGKYKEITEKIQEIEAPLKEKKDAIDDILKEKAAEEARLLEEKINSRIDSLIKSGMVFDGSYYSISGPNIPETSIGVVDIRTMSDEIFKQLMDVVVEKNNRILSEKKRIEEAEAAETLRLKQVADQQAAELKKQQDELLEAQKELKRQQDAIKEAQDKLDRDKKEAEDKAAQAERDRLAAIVSKRTKELVALGMEFFVKYDEMQYDEMRYEDIRVSMHFIETSSEGGWEECVADCKAKIEVKKATDLLEKQRSDAAEADRVEKIRLANEKERMEGLNDKQRLAEFLTSLLQVQSPEFKTKKYKAMAGAVVAGIKECLDNI